MAMVVVHGRKMRTVVRVARVYRMGILRGTMIGEQTSGGRLVSTMILVDKIVHFVTVRVCIKYVLGFE